MKHNAMRHGTAVAAVLATTAMAFSTGDVAALSPASPTPQPSKESNVKTTEVQSSHPYVGLWVTEDGHIRHELLTNGRYDEARGKVRSAYQGRYRVTGHHIDYVDDTGFTADGEFRDGVLYHAGMVLYRER